MKSIILHITEADKSYLPFVKPLLMGRAQTAVDMSIPVVAYDLVSKAKAKGASAIVSTSQELLRLLLPWHDRPRIDDYAGSFFEYKNSGVWFLFVDPLEHLVSKTYGKFVLERYLSKILHPENWLPLPEFKWELFSPARTTYLSRFFNQCTLISIDIETRINDPLRVITCVGLCGMQLSGGKMSMATVVVPLDDPYNLQFVRLVVGNKVPKVLQNGKYDIAYLLRYATPVSAYTFDTINLFHSWLSELPKDLGFISGFMLREYIFHKNDGKNGDVIQYYEYNAKDCYTTVLACMALLLELPEYGIQNFLAEFPVVFPCILSEATGIKWDSKRAEELKERVEKDMENEKSKLQRMVGVPSFNPNSPQQTIRLFALLGSKDVTSSTPPDKDKVASRHPLNKRIIEGIVKYREQLKLRSSYFKDGIPWLGRCFYALNPHGTDTGRLASRESQFWCGLQIQNIPRDGDEGDITVKEAFIADPDFYFGEADYSQAESRDTAYLSGDTNLIDNVDDKTRDFHGINASQFFGVPYEDIVHSYLSSETGEYVHKTLNKVLRNDIGKRVNHGANYNMGPQVMLDTMGIAKVLAARKTLGLPSHWSAVKVCDYLLDIFSKTYPIMKGPYYEKITNDVMSIGLLVGPTGWTRRCFGNPKKNKRNLNSYVAHPSQSLNAMTLNKAYVRVFQNVYLPNHRNFKLCAQIHDSILFQYRRGHEHLAWQVADMMCIPTPVTDTFGITRTLTVPVDLKGNGERWSEVEKLRAHAHAHAHAVT